MFKSRKKLNSEPAGPGCFLPIALVYSPAWRTLTSTEKDVLCFFLCRRQIGTIGTKRLKKKAILNNGKIIFAFAEAKDLGICKSTFAQALAKLEERGLVVRNKDHLDGMIDGIPVPRHYCVNVLDGRGKDEMMWATWRPKAEKRKRAGNHSHNLRQFATQKVRASTGNPSRRIGTG